MLSWVPKWLEKMKLHNGHSQKFTCVCCYVLFSLLPLGWIFQRSLHSAHNDKATSLIRKFESSPMCNSPDYLLSAKFKSPLDIRQISLPLMTSIGKLMCAVVRGKKKPYLDKLFKNRRSPVAATAETGNKFPPAVVPEAVWAFPEGGPAQTGNHRRIEKISHQVSPSEFNLLMLPDK